MQRRGLWLALLLSTATSLYAEEWEAVRARPGNDDIFVMIDTSAGMSPAAGGSLDRAKLFLEDVLPRYSRTGDRVIVMTFATDAHVHAVVPITDRSRDTALLREVVQGVDVSRTIHYSGVWPALTESAPGQWAGGGAARDFCMMWQFAARVIDTYARPGTRRLFLLITGGTPAPALYRACADPRPPAFFVRAVNNDNLAMCVIAAGTPRSGPDLAWSMRWLLQGLAAHARKAVDVPAVLELRMENGRFDGVRAEMLEFFNRRVDLVQPRTFTVPWARDSRLEIPLLLMNRSATERRIEITDAVLRFRHSDSVEHVDVAPPVLTLAPGQSGSLTVSTDRSFAKAERSGGELHFEFGPGSRFHPATVPFSSSSSTQSWAAYSSALLAVTASLLFVVLLVLLAQRAAKLRAARVATVTARYRGDPLAQPQRSLAVGGVARFGGGGVTAGGLFVNAEAPWGYLCRTAANDWLLLWPGHDPLPYATGTSAIPPGGGEHQAWQFFFDTGERSSLRRRLSSLWAFLSHRFPFPSQRADTP